MPTGQRIVIVGANGLLGKELGGALRERRFPAIEAKLVEAVIPAAPSTDKKVFEFDDEPALLEELTPAHLEQADVVFLAGTPESTRLAWPLLSGRSLLAVDLTGTLGGEAEAILAGIDPLGELQASASPDPTRLVVVAHPAAQTLALLQRLLSHAGPVSHAVATVFEPLSERGMAAMRELEQQTVNLLAIKGLPTEILGGQVAFNLRADLGAEARPTLDQVRERIARQWKALSGEACPTHPALTLLQAPLFHACVISLYMTFSKESSLAGLDKALESPWLRRYTAEEGYPDVVAAAGEDAVQLGPVRPAERGYWLFAVLDNLRRTAYSAVDAATALTRGRP